MVWIFYEGLTNKLSLKVCFKSKILKKLYKVISQLNQKGKGKSVKTLAFITTIVLSITGNVSVVHCCNRDPFFILAKLKIAGQPGLAEILTLININASPFNRDYRAIRIFS